MSEAKCIIIYLQEKSLPNLEGIFLFISHSLLSEPMVVELVYQMTSVVVVIQYSVEPMSSESSVLDLVLIFAERDDLVSVELILEERMMTLVSAVVVDPVHLVPVVWEERV